MVENYKTETPKVKKTGIDVTMLSGCKMDNRGDIIASHVAAETNRYTNKKLPLHYCNCEALYVTLNIVTKVCGRLIFGVNIFIIFKFVLLEALFAKLSFAMITFYTYYNCCLRVHCSS